MPFVPDKESRFVPDEANPMAANAGLANFTAGIVGLPMDTVQNAVNLGKAAVGAPLVAVGRPDLAPDLTTNIHGGSEFVRQQLRKTGIAGLNPDYKGDDASGRVAHELVSRGGFMPYGVLPAALSMVGEKVAGAPGAIVGALTPMAMRAAVSQIPQRPTAATNPVRAQTLRDARAEGYVAPPSAIRGTPSIISDRVESLAGKAAIGQEAALRNQQVTNRLANRALGLPENTALTEQTLTTLRTNLAAPYRAVAGLSQQAADTLQTLRDVRSEAQAQWRHYDRQAVPEAAREARRLDMQATQLEQQLEQFALQARQPALIPQLRQARQAIARTWDVERALNVGDANVSARIIGKALDRGRPLTGELKTIGRFSEAFPQYTRDGASVQAPGVSALELATAGLFGLGGTAAMGPGGGAMAALPFLRQPARSAMLSETYQNSLVNGAQPAPTQPTTMMQLLQQAAIANQQQ